MYVRSTCTQNIYVVHLPETAEHGASSVRREQSARLLEHSTTLVAVRRRRCLCGEQEKKKKKTFIQRIGHGGPITLLNGLTIAQYAILFITAFKKLLIAHCAVISIDLGLSQISFLLKI